jgi:hypothetical protein
MGKLRKKIISDGNKIAIADVPDPDMMLESETFYSQLAAQTLPTIEESSI